MSCPAATVRCGWAPAAARSRWPRPAGSPGSCMSSAAGRPSWSRSPRRGTSRPRRSNGSARPGCSPAPCARRCCAARSTSSSTPARTCRPAPVPGLQVAAFPAREDPRDALIWPGGTSLDALPPGARIGTGSPRRAALLRAAGRHLQIVPMRGNVGTRLRKLADGEVDALVLAMAGLSQARTARRGRHAPRPVAAACPPRRRACWRSSAAPTTR